MQTLRQTKRKNGYSHDRHTLVHIKHFELESIYKQHTHATISPALTGQLTLAFHVTFPLEEQVFESLVIHLY